MKPESLESLLIDRALGELAPEVKELLDAHLGANPEAARQADAWARTWRVARRAAAPEGDARLHPRPPARLRRRCLRNWKTHRAELLRLAACLVIGVATGWGLSATPPASPGSPPEASRPATFWSMTNLMKEYGSPSEPKVRPVRYELRWEPPIRVQRVEESHETSIR